MGDGWERLKNMAIWKMPLNDEEMNEVLPIMGGIMIAIIVLGAIGFGLYFLFTKVF